MEHVKKSSRAPRSISEYMVSKKPNLPKVSNSETPKTPPSTPKTEFDGHELLQLLPGRQETITESFAEQLRNLLPKQEDTHFPFGHTDPSLANLLGNYTGPVPSEVDTWAVENEKEINAQRPRSTSNGVHDPVVNWYLEEPKPKYKLFDYSDFFWNINMLKDDPWEDSEKPFVRIQELDEMALNKDELNGILSFRMIGACLSFLDKVPLNPKIVPSKLKCSNLNLVNIQCVAHHKYLAYIDLSSNALTEVSVLSNCKYLMYLDVSGNQLHELLDFEPPLYLTYVNYANNLISSIPDLSEFWSITYLNVSNNQIRKITGLQNLKFLRSLYLSNNYIQHLEGLSKLRIRILDLHNNEIKSNETEAFYELNGLHNLRELREVDLSYNFKTSLKMMKNATSVRKLNVSNNQIAELFELNNFRGITTLTDVNLTGNPVTLVPGYRPILIDCTLNIDFLDLIQVDAQEKIASNSVFSPDLHLCAIQHLSWLTLLKNLNAPVISAVTIPYDRNALPFIILVGPYGGYKRDIANNFVTKYPKNAYVGKMATTRLLPKTYTLTDLYTITREEFNEMTKNGEFLFTYDVLGESFGFAKSELVKGLERKDVCILTSDLVGALTIRMSGLDPILIKTMPSTRDIHYKALMKRFRTTYWSSTNPDSSAIKLVQRDVTLFNDVQNELDRTVDRKHREVYAQFTKNIIELDRTEFCCKCTCDCLKHFKYIKDWERFQMSRGSSHSASSSSLDSDNANDATLPSLSLHEESIRFIVDDMLRAREIYDELHIANPGLFIDSIQTDNTPEAMKKLLYHCKRAMLRYSEPVPMYEYKKDEVYLNMTNFRINQILEDLAIADNTALSQRKRAEIPQSLNDKFIVQNNETFEDIVKKYNTKRLDPNDLPEFHCPDHLLYSTYRTFTET